MIRRLRIGLLVSVAVLLQTALFPHLRIGGAAPDVGLVLVVAVATREGVEAGAALGFVTGLLVDLFLRTPLGLSALAFSLTGAAMGMLHEGLLRPGRWVAPLLGALGGLTANLLFIGVGILAAQDQLQSVHTLQVLGFAVLYDALIAAFVFPVGVWASGAEASPRAPAAGAGWTA
ncbi:MAG: rod shape-determining protein MreD [Actinobacteria bacterium]|nr:rod shape-determining protein MreD [Actinomycetota bacterium]